MKWTMLKHKMCWCWNGYRVEGTPKQGYTAYTPDNKPIAIARPHREDAERACERHRRNARREERNKIRLQVAA